MKLARNPKSIGFKHIGSGAFSSAYVDNLRTIELITIVAYLPISKKCLQDAINSGATAEDGSYFELTDMSREALILARQISPQHLKKYLPEITRLRIDKNKSGTVEFVYSMPYYNKFNSGCIKPTVMEEIELENILSRAADEIYKESFYSEMLMREFCFFDGYNKSLPSLQDDNLSTSDSGNVIFRDPLICLFFTHDAIRLFAKNFQSSESSYLSRYLKCAL